MNPNFLVKRYYRRRRKGNLVPKGLVMGEFDVSSLKGRLGWSLCMPIDQFKKSEANALANDKLNQTHWMSFEELIKYIKSMPHSLRNDAVQLVMSSFKRCAYRHSHGKI